MQCGHLFKYTGIEKLAAKFDGIVVRLLSNTRSYNCQLPFYLSSIQCIISQNL